MPVSIRQYASSDLPAIKRITIDCFEGVTLEQNVEAALGVLHDRDWRWRKARHIDDDVAAHHAGIFVAEIDGSPVGYVSTQIDTAAGKGRIANLAVAGELRGQGIGRQLIERALKYFRGEGRAYAVIETMAENEVGQYLYPACGFVAVGRQVHYARKL